MDIETRYNVQGEIGRGGQGLLFVAIERASGRRMAVKVQPPWHSESHARFMSLGRELFEEGDRNEELSAVPGIPDVFARGLYRGRRCIVMEYVDGVPLAGLVESVRPVKDLGTVAALIGQLCEILHGVHALNLVHCDVKPENVIVEHDGRVRLIDMGLGIAMGTEFHFSRGTPGFMAPEQYDGNPKGKGLTGQADIFGLGVMLLEMTVMRVPYGGTEERLLEEHAVLPADRLAQIPSRIRPLALSMVERDKDLRPPTMKAVFDALRPLIPVPGSRRSAKPLRPDPVQYYLANAPTL